MAKIRDMAGCEREDDVMNGVEAETMAMTPERIAELRAIAESFWSQADDSALASQCDATIQCLDEIERLRGWLDSIDALSHDEHDWEAHWLLEPINQSAHDALNGEAAPQ
jgi:hypothetical protein